MVVTEPTAVFDLYYVMVDVVFGSILISGFAMAFIMLVICMLGRISLPTTLIWIFFFFMVFTSGYIGGAALVIWFILAFVYMSTALIRYFYPENI